jgi:hypothetical protein
MGSAPSACEAPDQRHDRDGQNRGGEEDAPEERRAARCPVERQRQCKRNHRQQRHDHQRQDEGIQNGAQECLVGEQPGIIVEADEGAAAEQVDPLQAERHAAQQRIDQHDHISGQEGQDEKQPAPVLALRACLHPARPPA